MKFFIKFFTLLFIINCLLFGYGCSALGNSNSQHTADFLAFNTSAYIESYSSPISNKMKEDISNILLSLDNELSINNQNSITYQLNNSNALTMFSPSTSAYEIFQLSKEYYSFSDGKFNPAIYPLVKLWHFAPNYPVLNFNPPTSQSIEQIVNSNVLNFSNFILEDGKVYKTEQNSQIDFGSIAKGYACEKVAQYLKNNACVDGYVNIGSSSFYLIKTNSNISVKHPRKVGEHILSITGEKVNLSLSTSGDYEKNYIYNGTTYSHIINPLTGCPANTGIASATIICKSGAFSDAISTALCVFEHDYLNFENSELVCFMRKILTSYPQENCEFYVVFDNGEVKQVLTNRQKDIDFNLHDNSYNVVNF